MHIRTSLRLWRLDVEGKSEMYGIIQIVAVEEDSINLLGRCNSSNKPLEWTGHQMLSAWLPHAPCLPLRGSVRNQA